MTAKNHEPRYRAPALEKGLDILELLSTSSMALSLPMIASELGRSKGEIFRMAAVLEDRGYIRRIDGTETFVMTNRLFELGMRNPPIRNLIEVSGPLMHKLARATNQSCLLAVASGDQIVVVYSTEAPGNLSFSVRIGHRQPLLQSASGRTLLAFQESDTQEEWLQAEDNKALQATLRKRVTTIRNQGYESASSEMIKGILDLSAPIFDGKSPGAIASLTMTLVEYLNQKEVRRTAVKAIQETASEISSQLSIGYQ